MRKDQAIQSEITANRRRAFLLLGGVVIAVALLGLIVGAVAGLPGVGLGAGLVAAVGAAVWVYLASDRVALGMSGAEPASAAEFPRYYNVVDGLCVAAGIPRPALHVVRDGALNAFATGRDPHHAALVVTTGLLERLNRIELEGVLAQQLSHIRNYDTLTGAIAVPLFGMVAPSLVPVALNRDRESAADRTGVRLTRYPPGLIAALEKLRTEPVAVANAKRATAHLWFESPRSRTHPPLDARIAALRDM